MHVTFYADLVSDPVEEVQRLQRFVGVEPIAPTDVGRRVNPTTAPRHPRLARALWALRRPLLNSRAESIVAAGKRLGLQGPYQRLRRTELYDDRPRVDADVDQRLRDELSEDISDLEAMLGVDLSRWRSPAA